MLSKLKDKYVFYAGICAFFYLGCGAFNVILSMYCQDIGLSASQISYIVSFSPLLSIITQPVFGYLADKWRSPRKVSILLEIVCIIMTFIFAVSRNFWILLLSSGINLSFVNAITPLTDRICVSSKYDFGKIRLWGSIGYAIMAQISGILYDQISPFANFMASILGILLFIACVYMVSDPHMDENVKKEKNKISGKIIAKELIHNKSYMLFLAISFFFLGGTTANYNYLSMFIKSVGGTATDVGTYQLWATLFEIPMILATDYLIKKFPFKYIMMFAISASLVNYIWYSTLPNYHYIIYVFVFKGFSTILFTMINVRLIIMMVKDEYVSTAYGIQYMVGRGIGATVIQMIGGRIIDGSGMHQFYIFLSICILIGLLLTAGFNPKKAKTEQL